MDDPRKAQTQYKDYTGEASADIADGKNLADLAQQLHIDKGFWPVGFAFDIGDTGLSVKRPKVNVSIYAVDSDEYGSGINAINKSVLSKNSELLVKCFSKKMPMQEFFTFFKRFHVTGFNRVLHAEVVYSTPQRLGA